MNKDSIQPHEMAQLPGVIIRTLQRWDNDGIFKARRTPANRRFYTYDPYLACAGQKSDEKTDDRKAVIYTRVSAYSQKEDLKNQIEFLKTFANARGIIADEISTDIERG